MRLAYADPPYFGCGTKHYAEHHEDAADWDRQETHLELVARLVDEFPDGWALSCNSTHLRWLLPACPEDVRVGAWTKTFHQIRPMTTQYAWEPVIFRGGRKDPKRAPMVRDWLSCQPTMRTGLAGAKPEAFNRWVLDLLGWLPGDELADLFPGTGGMGVMLERAAGELSLELVG